MVLAVAERLLEELRHPGEACMHLLPLWSELGKTERILQAEEVVHQSNQRLVRQAEMVARVVK